MSIQLNQKVKELEKTVAALEARFCLLEMAVHRIETDAPVIGGMTLLHQSAPKRSTLSLKSKAA